MVEERGVTGGGLEELLTCEWRAMPFPRIWLNCFWPMTVFANTTIGANRPLPSWAFPMRTTAFTGLCAGMERVRLLRGATEETEEEKATGPAEHIFRDAWADIL